MRNTNLILSEESTGGASNGSAENIVFVMNHSGIDYYYHRSRRCFYKNVLNCFGGNSDLLIKIKPNEKDEVDLQGTLFNFKELKRDALKQAAKERHILKKEQHAEQVTNEQKIEIENKIVEQEIKEIEDKPSTRGVTYCKKNTNNPYRVRITVKGKVINVGEYPTIEEASAAYKKAKLLHTKNILIE